MTQESSRASSRRRHLAGLRLLALAGVHLALTAACAESGASLDTSHSGSAGAAADGFGEINIAGGFAAGTDPGGSSTGGTGAAGGPALSDGGKAGFGSNGGSASGGGVPGIVTNGIVHPGLMTTLSQLQALKGRVERAEEPWSDELERLKARVERSTRTLHNPARDNDVGGGALIYCGSYNKNQAGTAKVLACDWPVEDGIDAYTFALLGYLTDNASYFDMALEYLESWTSAQNFRGFDGSNAPLQHGWTIPWYANTAELLRYTYAGWRDEHTQSMLAFLEQMLPRVLDDREGAPNNWLHSRIEAHMAAAIFASDGEMLSVAIERWQTHTRSYVYIDSDQGVPVLPSSSKLGAQGAAAWNTPKFVAGMTLETCRDLNHQDLGMRSIFNSLAMASNQGRDMLAGNDNRERLVAFLEFMPALAQARQDHPYGICNAPIIVNPPDGYLRDVAERVPYEIAYSLLSTAQTPLATTRQELELAPPTGAGRWVTKWEALTHNPATQPR